MEYIFENVKFLFVLIPVIVLHELAHALMALKFGDDTARLSGRLTLNPLKHLDLNGTILLLLVGFGWAKPVMVDPTKFKNPRRDMALVALAGPAVNFILAVIMAIILSLVMMLTKARDGFIVEYFFSVIRMTLVLGVFNLIPIPPLDGSKIVALLLPPGKLYDTYTGGGLLSFILLLVLLATGVLGGILFPIVYFIMENIITPLIGLYL